jgi:hypothetical protein
MNLSYKNKTTGRILFFDNEGQLYKSKENSLFNSNDNGASWNKVFSLKAESITDILGYSSHWSCRFLRKGYHNLCVSSKKEIGLIFNKQTAILKNGLLSNQSTLIGSRPLSLERIGSEYVFGEYRSNKERSEIGIYGFNSHKKLYRKLQLCDIRHIHGIYQDPYTDLVWITVGDEDNESAILATDTDFTKIDKILSGSQQYRTIKLLFTKEYIYFGSDAPEEVNFIYRMNKKTYNVEQLVEVGNTVFHGCKVGNWLFFSTAVEPSKTNSSKEAKVWGSPNGNDWKCIFSFKKDLLPMKAFQYGQIFFPSGEGNGEDLWISLFATEHSNKSFMYKVRDIEELFNL